MTSFYISARAGVGPATDKQVAFLDTLVARGAGPAVDTTTLTKRQASALISAYKSALAAQPKPTTPTPVAAITATPGMYRTADGTIYKVQKARQSDRVYAKKLVPINGVRLSETDERVQWQFEYAPGAVRTLTDDMRLTVEAAREFGIQFGVCAVCGRTLVDADSITAGIGPVCARRLA